MNKKEEKEEEISMERFYTLGKEYGFTDEEVVMAYVRKPAEVVATEENVKTVFSEVRRKLGKKSG